MAKPDQYVVSTFYWKPGMKTPISHVFGTRTQMEARRVRRELLAFANADPRIGEEGAVFNVSVNKVLWEE